MTLDEKAWQSSLPMRKSILHLTADEQSVRDGTDQTEANFIVNHVADQRPLHTLVFRGQEFVAVMPGFEWTLSWTSVKWWFHRNSVMRAIHGNAERQKREDTEP